MIIKVSGRGKAAEKKRKRLTIKSKFQRGKRSEGEIRWERKIIHQK